MAFLVLVDLLFLSEPGLGDGWRDWGVIGWVFWGRIGLNWFFLFFMFGGFNGAMGLFDVEFFDWIIEGIVPPAVVPALFWVIYSFDSEAEVVLSSLDLDTVNYTGLFFAESFSFCPAVLHHHFHAEFALNLLVGDSWALEKSLSIFAGHQQCLMIKIFIKE